MRYRNGFFIALVLLFCSFVSADEVKPLVEGNSAFAFALQEELFISQGNFFFSPYSVSNALAMTYAGARGNTEQQMARTLGFSMGQEQTHSRFQMLDSDLIAQKNEGIILTMANSLWPARACQLLDGYFHLVKRHYGVSIESVDYKGATDAARVKINKWVEEKTQGKIANLIAPGIINRQTRMVLVNAIYFNGKWDQAFLSQRTKNAPFYISPKKSVDVPMMESVHQSKYADMGAFQILELPYMGKKFSMVVFLPKAKNGVTAFERGFSFEALAKWRGLLQEKQVMVYLPKFKMTSTFRLDPKLIAMGMRDAFDEWKADFSGMDGQKNGLYIAAVIHKAFVEVSEEGTEAAAATAVAIVKRGMPANVPSTPVFLADHPFLFLIQDNQTGTILFMGRLSNPNEA